MQRLEELVEWQRLQQEKLKRQQEEQRQLLSQEQKRIYEVFGLGRVETRNDPSVSSDSTKDARFVAATNSLTSCADKNYPDNYTVLSKGKQGSEQCIEIPSNEVIQLKSTSTEVPRKMETSTVVIDDLPINSSKRDFYELVQESLELERNSDCANDSKSIRKPKHKFLRKGEGLARFGTKLETSAVPVQGSKYKGKLKNSKSQVGIVSASKEGTEKCSKSHNNLPLSRKEADRAKTNSPQVKSQDKVLKSSSRFSPISKLILKSVEKKQCPPATWAHVLQQSPTHPDTQDSLETSSQELDKSKKELEELRTFELLEQHAANSSFCSTSSLVARLLGDSVKSTPVKLDLKRQNAYNQNHYEHFSVQKNISDNQPACEVSRVIPYQGPLLSYTQTHNNRPSMVFDECEELQTEFEKCDPFQARQFHLKNSMGHNEVNPSHKVQETISKSEYQVTNARNDTCFINKTGVGKGQSLSVRFAIDSNAPPETEVQCCHKSTTGISQSFNLESVPEEEVQISGKQFQDEHAWSDMCSCTSCEASDSDYSEDQSSPEENNGRLEGNNTSPQQQSPKADYLINSPNNVNISPQIRANKREVITTTNSVILQNIASASSANTTNFKLIPQDKALTAQGQSKDDMLSFKSTLLRDRLQELEKEIEIFQRENSNLLKLKQQHEEEATKFRREKKEMERKVSEERKQLEDMLQGERKKLAKEKLVFEKYCKDLKNHPTRQEREEIQELKLQVASLQEELIKKDSRWSALQVRSHDRLTQLNKDIARLKEENEKLKQEKEKVKKVRFSNPRLKGSNTKALHTINRQIGKIKAADMEDIVIRNVVPKKKIPSSILSQRCSDNGKPRSEDDKVNEWGHRANGNLKCFVSVPDMRPETSPDELEEKVAINDPNSGAPSYAGFHQCSEDDVHSIESDGTEDVNRSNTFKNTEEDDKLQKTVYDAFYSTLEEMIPDVLNSEGDKNEKVSNNVHRTSTTDGYNHLLQLISEGKVSARDSTNKVESEENGLRDETLHTEMSETVPHGSSENNKDLVVKQSNKETFVETVSSNGTREKVFADGRQEIWFPNGNVKKVSADRSVVKMIYYNGDVKEKFLNDGMEKYYYAETNTWHTTYLDGLDILEFPNGQMERRQKDGTTEITYPNSCVRLCYSDGREEWSMPDGTVMKMDCTGEKVLLLPNGQKEIHTMEHKRREYPDGTVKFLYPDGLQETRYANGRIRLKDKDGQLVMDSAVV